VGLTSAVAPLGWRHLGDVERRGSLVALYQLAITVGILAAYLIDLALAPAEAWRWMIGLGVLPAAILLVGVALVPETPRFLLARGREREAREVLARVAAPDRVDGEIAAIRAEMAAEGTGSWSQVFSPALRGALIVGVGLAVLQQLTGINTVIYYAPTIFQQAGFDSDNTAILGSVVVGVVNVLATIIAVRFVDRVGRRPLLMLGLGGMVLSLACLGAGFAADTGNDSSALGLVAVASLVVYVASFAFSLGPIVWLMISEIFPLGVRARAVGLATMANWTFNLIVSLTFLSLLEDVGTAVTFWLYAGVGLLSILFVYRLVPETKGKTLEEITVELRRGAADETPAASAP
jgi:sugar porter (SP) family MFS transporter